MTISHEELRTLRRAVYRMICRAAEEGKPAPSLEHMARVKGTTPVQIKAAIRKLTDLGKIVPALVRQRAIYTVPALGKSTAAVQVPPLIWTDAKKAQLQTLWYLNPPISYAAMAEALGVSRGAIQKQANTLCLVSIQRERVAKVPAPKPAAGYDPLLARLIEVYGGRPWTRAPHRPNKTLPVVPIKTIHVGRQAPC